MLQKNPNPPHSLDFLEKSGDPEVLSAVSSLFDSLVSMLDKAREEKDHLRSLLEVVVQGCNVQAGYWKPHNRKEAPLLVSLESLDTEWLKRFSDKLVIRLGESPQPLIWNHSESGQTFEDANNASGAIVFRINGHVKGWLVFLTFDPDRRLDRSDVTFIRAAKEAVFHKLDNNRTISKLKGTLVSLLRCLAAIIDAKDSYTAGHSERVARIAVAIGEELSLSKKKLHNLYLAGMLHDIGKIGIPDRLLLKPGELSPSEFDIVKEHTVIGDRIISTVPLFERLRCGVRNHHERFDGGGYPDRLRGKEIPLLARVLAVADTCDALMSTRRYRRQFTPPQIDKVMLEGKGSQFDPKILRAFMSCRERIYPPLYEKGIGESAHHAVEALL